MKQSLIARAVGSLIGAAALAVASLASAQVAPPTSVSVTSTVNGGSSSYSQANGVNQASTHGAGAYSTNTANASGSGFGSNPLPVVGPYYAAGAQTATTTTGSTVSGAYGVGAGSSSAGADQFGSAVSNQNVNAVKPAGTIFGIPYGNGGAVGNVNTQSSSQVGSQSNTTINNSGIGASGSNANAWNNSGATVSAPSAGTSNAVGAIAGNAAITTWGLSTQPSNNGAGGTLNVGTVTNVGGFQSGGYGGTITRP